MVLPGFLLESVAFHTLNSVISGFHTEMVVESHLELLDGGRGGGGSSGGYSNIRDGC